MMRIGRRNIEWSKKRVWMSALITAVIMFAFIGSAQALQKRDLRRSHNGGMVDMDVVFMNPLQQNPGTSSDLIFEIRMNTHSVNLDSFKLEELALLSNDVGDQARPVKLDNPAGGGHHRSGILRFPAQTLDGKNLIRGGVNSIELVIRDVAGVPERIFRWELPLQ
ncbi:MAG: hypothetical protein JRG73_11815 [Deltaproteobacteria bacterium]|nr:hypothetical protein [Deltaproteobacteria bacterium]MBW2307608.1 hypothetical protein [Deltaproteobacteria bacterium]